MNQESTTVATNTVITALQATVPALPAALDNREAIDCLCAVIGERCGAGMLGSLVDAALGGQISLLCDGLRANFPTIQKVGASWSQTYNDQGEYFAALDQLVLTLTDGETVSLNPSHCELAYSEAFEAVDVVDDADEAIRLFLVERLGCDPATTSQDMEAMHDTLMTLVSLELEYHHAGVSEVEFEIDLHHKTETTHVSHY